MPAITIALLVDAIAGIVKVSGEVIKLIDELPSRRKVREEDVASIKAQVDELAQAQLELKHSLSALASTLDAYIRVYFDLNSITADCEMLQMYVKENRDDLAKKSTSDRVWSSVSWRFEDIQRETRNKYKMANINQSGLLDPKDLSKIEVYVRNFDTASTQAGLCIKNRWLDELYDYVEAMVRESQEIGNVLQHRINIILSQSGDL